MTRIIAGEARGRQLKVPASGTRPTADRVRESVFSSLAHDLGDWEGLSVLDLYAGSGAFGLESVSRGAARAVLVDHASAAAQALRANVAATGLAATVVQSDVGRWLAVPAPAPFDLVFIDPPYELPAAAVVRVLTALAAGGWLADEAMVVVERASRSEPLAWPEGFSEVAHRRFGDTEVRRSVWYVSDEDESTPDQADGLGNGSASA